ncbi:MAG: glucose-1-phosphate adenylyltransferase [Deltaproteobacteria bacterium]|nr:MAG: glucose-1-phosphate adenylyltransferase [Deltaproteobacteria bacterium]
MNRTLVMILAGGQGARLMPLTRDRAKPAVPFGGRYRIIDFVLSNFVNSGFYRIKILTQYKSQSLNAHIARAWRLARVLDHYVECVPAQQRTGLDWYRGSADAIYQNLNLIRDESPRTVAVFGGDHIYKMDVSQMLAFHLENDADLTVAAIPVRSAEASAFGVIEVDESGRMVGFEEKPDAPREMPGRPGWSLVSMGNYLFRTAPLIEAVTADAEDTTSAHDFGHNILPTFVREGRRVFVYDFSTNRIPGPDGVEPSYWRDVGTIRNYMDASMDLIAAAPDFNLYNPRWPIRSDYLDDPPAKFVHDQGDRVGIATESLVCDGAIISGGRILRSLLGPRVRVNSFSHVEGCVLFDDVNVGRHARLRNVIVDKGVTIPSMTHIGFDPEEDRARGFTVTRDGLVVLAKGTLVPEP